MKLKVGSILIALFIPIGAWAVSDYTQTPRLIIGLSIISQEDSIGRDTTLKDLTGEQSLSAEKTAALRTESETIVIKKDKITSPRGALFRSAIIPGWGQVYNRQYIKAVLYGGTEIALAAATVHYWKKMDSHQSNFTKSTDPTYQAWEYYYYQSARDNRNLFLWLSGLTFFISIFDAYVDAHFADFNQQDKAFQANLTPNKDGLFLSFNVNLK
jgi:hypothetical protein